MSPVQAALRQLGLPAGASYISDLLTQYDRDKNREVQFSEFKRCANKFSVPTNLFSSLLRRRPVPFLSLARPLPPAATFCPRRSVSGRCTGTSTATATGSWMRGRCTGRPPVRQQAARRPTSEHLMPPAAVPPRCAATLRRHAVPDSAAGTPPLVALAPARPAFPADALPLRTLPPQRWG